MVLEVGFQRIVRASSVLPRIGIQLLLCLCCLDSARYPFVYFAFFCSWFEVRSPKILDHLEGRPPTPKFEWFPARAETEFVSSLEVQRRSRRGLSGTAAAISDGGMHGWLDGKIPSWWIGQFCGDNHGRMTPQVILQVLSRLAINHPHDAMAQSQTAPYQPGCHHQVGSQGTTGGHWSFWKEHWGITPWRWEQLLVSRFNIQSDFMDICSGEQVPLESNRFRCRDVRFFGSSALGFRGGDHQAVWHYVDARREPGTFGEGIGWHSRPLALGVGDVLGGIPSWPELSWPLISWFRDHFQLYWT